jgi:hypothetical protein
MVGAEESGRGYAGIHPRPREPTRRGSGVKMTGPMPASATGERISEAWAENVAPAGRPRHCPFCRWFRRFQSLRRRLAETFRR